MVGLRFVFDTSRSGSTNGISNGKERQFMRLSTKTLAEVAAACMAVQVFGQATSADPKAQLQQQQAQIERMQRDMAKLQAELEALKQQAKPAQPATNPEEVEQLKRKVDVLEHEVSKQSGFRLDL